MRGFTFIECLLYIALFGISMTGIVSCVYAIKETASRNEARSALEFEGNFLLQKIDYEIGTSLSVSTGSGNNTSNSLLIVPRTGALFYFQTISHKAVRTLGSSIETISGNDVSVDSLTFTQVNGMVQTKLTLSSNVSHGQVVRETFSNATLTPL